MRRLYCGIVEQRRTDISRTKQQLTDIFRAESGAEIEFKDIWQNTRETGGLRLTDRGVDLLDIIELEKFSVDLKDVRLTNQFYLDLDKYMDCPYYIQTGRWPKIYIYSERTYFWLIINNKNWDRFLASHKNK